MQVAHNTREVRIPECFAKAPKSPVVRQALARVPDQVMSKFLGCGSPIPLGIQGLRCGAGRAGTPPRGGVPALRVLSAASASLVTHKGAAAATPVRPSDWLTIWLID